MNAEVMAPRYHHRKMTPAQLLAECTRLNAVNSKLQKRKPIPENGIGLTNAELRRLANALRFLEDNATITIDGLAIGLKHCGAFRTLLQILAQADG